MESVARQTPSESGASAAYDVAMPCRSGRGIVRVGLCKMSVYESDFRRVARLGCRRLVWIAERDAV